MTFVDFTEQQKLTASDAADYDYFGYSVDVSGDTVIVGAFQEDPGGKSNAGSAYIYTRSGESWTEQQKISASDSEINGYFGRSVAIDGDTAIIGSYLSDTPTEDAGAVYVFTRSGGTWSQQQKLIASDGGGYDYFGRSVAIDGDTLIVGSINHDDPSYNTGAAYIFAKSGGTWSQQQEVSASDAASGDYFGISVAIDGDTAVVGAYYDTHSSITRAGSAYVFVRSGGTWSQQQKLTASDAAFNDRFGHSVAIYGETIIVGCEVGNRAYVFSRYAGVWTEDQILEGSDLTGGESFGYSVAISGDIVIIGASSDAAPSGDSGSAYVFTLSDGSWTEQQKITPSDSTPSGNFGLSVAIDGDTAVIGCEDESSSSTNAGAAYVLTTVLPEDPDEEVTEEPDVTKKYTGESYSLLLRDGDIQVDDNGTPKYDYTAESRVYFRLMCRRGQCWYDPDLGSRLYTIKTLKEAKQKVPAYVDEALLPLVKDGTIISAAVDDYYEEPITGMLKAHLMITVPSDKKVDLGLIPIGRTA